MTQSEHKIKGKFKQMSWSDADMEMSLETKGEILLAVVDVHK